MKAVGSLDRQKYIGGSDVAAILGISPWRTALETYEEKILPRKAANDPDRERVLTRGKRLEPYVIDMLAEETGFKIVERGRRYKHPDHPFIAAEIDFEYIDPGTGQVENGEIKTVSPFKAADWGEVQSDEIPVYYTAQSQHGMMVTGRSHTLYGVLIGADDFRLYRVDRDDEVISYIRQAEIEFWQRIQARNPPPPSNIEDVLRMYARDSGISIQATDAVAARVRDLKSTKLTIKELEAKADELKQEICLFMGEASTLMWGSKQLASWRSQETNRFDVDAFRLAHAKIAERYTKKSTTRVLRLK